MFAVVGEKIGHFGVKTVYAVVAACYCSVPAFGKRVATPIL